MPLSLPVRRSATRARRPTSRKRCEKRGRRALSAGLLVLERPGSDFFVQTGHFRRHLLILRVPFEEGRDFLRFNKYPLEERDVEVVEPLAGVDFSLQIKRSWQPFLFQAIENDRRNTDVLCFLIHCLLLSGLCGRVFHRALNWQLQAGRCDPKER